MKTVGKQLQDARLAKEWSPELAARETKIKVERLRDLEADDFSNFSSPTYARGFVRTYARALGLDEYKLLRQLDNKLPEDDNASFANDTGVPYMPEPSKVSTPYRFSTGFFVALGAGATVLFLIAFVLFQSYRAGYFAQALPAVAAPVATNSLPAIPDSDSAARALPADSNAAPVALPVDVGPATAAAGTTPAAPVALPVNPAGTPVAADTGTNAASAIPVAPAAADDTTAAATTPLDTKTPPRALPVDLSTLSAAQASPPATPSATPVAAPADSTVAAPAASPPVTLVSPAAPTTAPVPTAATAPAANPTPAISARASDARPDPAPQASLNATTSPTPIAAAAVSSPAADPAPANVASSPVAAQASTDSSASSTPPVYAAPAAQAAPVTTASETAVATAVTPPVDSAPALTGEAPAASGTEGKRLVLKASRDSYIRVVSLDNPDGEQVRYSSVLHEGQSISFNDRKYSINIGVPSAVDILLDGINYGPHSDHSEPDTFTVESHQP